MGSHYEAGRYAATIRRQGFSESKEKGTPFFFIEVEPFEALDANQLPEVIYSRRVDMYLTEKAAPYAFEKMRFLGWDGRRLGDLDPDDPNHHSFVNEIVTVVNNPDGEYDKFDLVREGSDVQHKAGLAANLDKLYAKTLAAKATGNGAKPKPRAEAKPTDDERAAAAGFDSPEIPF